jgi:hypothetical protein
LNREPTTAGRALKAVSLVIILVSVTTFSTMIYSAWQDASGVLSAFGSGGITPTSNSTVTGNTALIEVDYVLPNDGLYPISLRFACVPDPSIPVTCQSAEVEVPPGLAGRFAMVIMVSDVSRLQQMTAAGEPVHLNVTASVSLVPFATLSTSFDLGSLLEGGSL